VQARRTCNAKGFGRLGPSAPAAAKRCDRSFNNGLQLNLMTSATSKMQWKFVLVIPPSPPPPPPSPPPPPPSPPPPPAAPAPPPSPPPRPSNFCTKTPKRAVYSGRRVASALSGIRPCFPQSPRANSPQECCRQCLDDDTCIAFTFIRDGGLDCRAQGLEVPFNTGACYLIDTYTGSYEPIQSFAYYSSKAFD